MSLHISIQDTISNDKKFPNTVRGLYPWCQLHPYYMKSIQVQEQTWPTSLHYIYASLLPTLDQRTIQRQNYLQHPIKLFTMIKSLLDERIHATTETSLVFFDKNEVFQDQEEYKNYLLYELFLSKKEALALRKRNFLQYLPTIFKERMSIAFRKGYFEIIQKDPFLRRLAKTTPKQTIVQAPYSLRYTQFKNTAEFFEQFGTDALNFLRNEPTISPFDIIRYRFYRKEWVEQRVMDIFKTLEIMSKMLKFLDINIVKNTLQVIYGCCYTSLPHSIVRSPPEEFISFFMKSCPKPILLKDIDLYIYTIWCHICILLYEMDRMPSDIVQLCKMDIPTTYSILEVYHSVWNVIKIIQTFRKRKTFHSDDLRYVKDILRISNEKQENEPSEKEKAELKDLIEKNISTDYKVYDFIIQLLNTRLDQSRIYFYL